MTSQHLNNGSERPDTNLADDLQFNFSDIDMDYVGAKAASPFEIDLSSLFTRNSCDPALLSVAEKDFSVSQRNPSYDACESSAESTSSRDGVVSLNLEPDSKKRKTNPVQTALPNFTPLVLTGIDPRIGFI